MSDQLAIISVIGLAIIVIALFIYNGRAKARFEAERAQRRAELERIKAEARARNVKSFDEG